MQYIALKEMTTSTGPVQPGDLVPEAADWDMCWFTTGHVAAYPDEMIPQVRKHLHTGHLQMHGSEFGQGAVGQALSQAARGGSDNLAVRESAEAVGVPPAALAPPDAAPATPAAPITLEPSLEAIAAAEAESPGVDEVDEGGPEDTTPAADGNTTQDKPRGRMGRRRPR